MKTTITRIGTVAAIVLGLTAFTGSAIAGNGNGNGGGTPPGQEKKADQAAPAAQPAAQPTAPPAQGNPGQQKKAEKASQPSAPSQSTAKSPGQAKQAAKASTSTPGVKPSNSTSKWTHCSTGGGTGTAATCSGNGPKADGSKQYGNGKTAAQIANSRGAPAGTKLTGPGNSQPHKVSVCGKPNNKSGGVDVHAVKSYSAANCSPSQSQSVATTPGCTGTMTATVRVNKHGKVKAHGKGKQETLVTSTFVPGKENCAAQAQGGTAPAAGGTAPATATAAGTAPATATAAGNGTAAGTPAANGVLGTQVVVLKPVKKHAAGGVLGATARLGTVATSGTLPFTGLPLWIVVLVALALIAGGLAVRSRRPSRQL
jgi:hypothetical protein